MMTLDASLSMWQADPLPGDTAPVYGGGSMVTEGIDAGAATTKDQDRQGSGMTP